MMGRAELCVMGAAEVGERRAAVAFVSSAGVLGASAGACHVRALSARGDGARVLAAPARRRAIAAGGRAATRKPRAAVIAAARGPFELQTREQYADPAEEKIRNLGFSMEDVDDRVVDAVQNTRSSRVSVSDVAALSGLQLANAERELVKLAALTAATLEVSSDGDILYEFPQNVRAALSSSSRARRVREFIQKLAPVISYIARVSFGIALVASVVIVFSAIAVISSSSSRDNENRERRSYNGGSVMYVGPRYSFFGPSWYDLFWYDPYYSYRRARAVERGERSMGFLEAVFSFVFGDGDTSKDVEDKRWKAVARMIRANDGAVVAEQLRPLLDPSEEDRIAEGGNLVSERFMLPALIRFGGHPEVTEDGELIYVFPELQKTASQVDDVRAGYQLDGRSSFQVLEEPLRKFSLASAGQRLAAGALGVVNFLGVVFLGSLLSEPRVLANPDLRTFLPFIQGLYPALSIYALGFLIIPAVRALWLQRVNAGIAKRNSWREAGAALLEGAARGATEAGRALRRKLDSALKYRTQSKVYRRRDALYRSDESVQRPDNDLADFDRRLYDRA